MSIDYENRGICSYCSHLADVKKCSQCKSETYCSRNCQKLDWKFHKALCQSEERKITEIEEQNIPKYLKVEVRDSPIHGKGVYATEDIKVGERICFFDGDTKDSKIKISMSKSTKGVLTIKNAEESFDKILGSLDTHDICLAHPDKHKKSLIRLGCPEGSRSSAFGLGQFINDRTCPKFPDLDFDLALQVLQKYAKNSTEAANCEIDSKFWFRSFKLVRKGEELFTHYGVEFWLQKRLLEAQDPDWRFLFYSLQRQSAKPFDLRKFYEYDEETCKIFLKKMVKKTIHEDSTAKDVIMNLTGKINIR